MIRVEQKPLPRRAPYLLRRTTPGDVAHLGGTLERAQDLARGGSMMAEHEHLLFGIEERPDGLAHGGDLWVQRGAAGAQ